VGFGLDFDRSRGCLKISALRGCWMMGALQGKGQSGWNGSKHRVALGIESSHLIGLHYTQLLSVSIEDESCYT
jgi:hypothetical protein